MSHRLRLLALGLTSLLVGGLVRPAAAAPAPQVAIIGDSISDRSRTAIGHAIEPAHDIVFFKTQNSATIARVGPILLDEVARPDGPDIALVELGTGNAFWGTDPADFRRQVRSLTRRLLEHVTCVRWFEQKPGGNLAYPSINRQAVRFNQIVREEVNTFARARTVHYEAWTRLAGDGVFVPDLLHLNARGKRGLARLARQAVEGCDPVLTSGRFWDVPDRYWASTEIDWVGDHHLIDGYGNGTYRAEVGGIVPALDRLGWLRALWRRAGRPDGDPFGWDATEDVTRTRADFRPGAAVTRADAVQWLYRASGRPDASGYPDPGLADVPAGVRRAVRWAHGVGILTMPPGGSFLPRRPLTRAEAAVYLYRAAHALPPPPAPPAPNPPPSTTTTTTLPTTTVPTTTLPPTTLPPTTLPRSTTAPD